MRACFCVIAAIGMSSAGCNLLTGYFVRGVHYPLGTAAEMEFDKSVAHLCTNLKIILHEQGFSTSKFESSDESAMFRATKDGLQYIIDVTSIGSGSKVHIEINQAANDKILWSMLNDLKMFP